MGILSGAGSRFRFHASCQKKKSPEILRSLPSDPRETHRWLSRTYHRSVGSIRTACRYRNYIQRSHSTDGNHHRRVLSYYSQQNRYQYYHSSDYMRRIYLFFTAWIQGNQQISQYLHLHVLWSDRIRIIIRW